MQSLYNEIYNRMNRCMELLKKPNLSEKEVGFIKGTVMDSSFLLKDAGKDDMFGYLVLYNTLKAKWEERNVS